MCISPLDGWYSRSRNASGKRSVTFQLGDGLVDRPVTVPCGRCRECRLEYARQWAMRCMHEASLYEDNCFITLTYSDDHLPELASLRKRDFQLFMKRLRSKYVGVPIRFYHCGEYGSWNHRPHYHALLFGFDFLDKVHWSVRNGFPVWRSKSLEEIWPLGQSEIGSVSFESASYVARYMMDKFKNSDEDLVAEHYRGRESEYCTMSRRPGIGKRWFDEFKCEVYASDSVIVRGKEVRPPKFYDSMYEIGSPIDMARLRGKRKRSVNYDDQRSSRLLAKKVNLEARDKLFSRREL